MRSSDSRPACRRRDSHRQTIFCKQPDSGWPGADSPISAWRTRISGCEANDEFSFRTSHRFKSIKLIEQDGGKELEVHYVRESLAKAGFKILKSLKKHMWIPVEIVLGIKE
jgi:hypothetical protein